MMSINARDGIKTNAIDESMTVSKFDLLFINCIVVFNKIGMHIFLQEIVKY